MEKPVAGLALTGPSRHNPRVIFTRDVAMPRRRSPRHATLWFLVLVLGMAGFAWFQARAAEGRIAGGAPEAVSYDPDHWLHVLNYPCHSLGYSEWRGNPLWVAYRIRPAEKRQGLGRERFETDPRTLRRVSFQDYTGSGYDRGHLAPSHAIGQLCGKNAQRATYRMSNITPQRPNLNRKLWERLEEVELDTFTARLGEIQVIAGPIFADKNRELRTGIDIPIAFYKIYYQPRQGSRPARALALRMPQDVSGYEPLSDFVTSIDAIESETGLDFFPHTDDPRQPALEATAGVDPAFGLASVARLPPRY